MSCGVDPKENLLPCCPQMLRPSLRDLQLEVLAHVVGTSVL